MPSAVWKPCTTPGCPVLVQSGKCDDHAKAADRARGTTAQRGYGAGHKRLRALLAPKVATGNVLCWRCLQPIVLLETGEPEAWHLGHDDAGHHRGPEHERCNDGAAARKGNRSRGT